MQISLKTTECNSNYGVDRERGGVFLYLENPYIHQRLSHYIHIIITFTIVSYVVKQFKILHAIFYLPTCNISLFSFFAFYIKFFKFLFVCVFLFL